LVYQINFFLLGDKAVTEAISTIAYFPVLVLAARVCPPGVEGTLYALLLSVLNLGSVISEESGSLLTKGLGITAHNFSNLWLLILICGCTAILPLPLLYILVPDRDSDTVQGGLVTNVAAENDAASAAHRKAALLVAVVSAVEDATPMK